MAYQPHLADPLSYPGSVDSFGHLITGSVNNQIDVQFYRATSDSDLSNIITETEANGGTASKSNGMATFAATTTASSRAKGVSLTNTVYTAGAEVYAIFTAAFTGTGSGTSYHRIGLYSDYTNGFYIGYEAGTFGVTILKGGSPTQTPKASFSVDTLTGAATSLYTRNGTPEAINLTLLNVFRIRFGWVGSAPIEFEVLSPDGNWVTFHVIKQPNLTALPSINTADLSFTCDVNSGNSGAALSILTNCWCAGTTQNLVQLNGNRALNDRDYATLTRSVIVGENSSAGGSYVNVKVNPSGSLETNAAISSLPNEGQQTMANSISVAIASNQSSVPVTEASAADIKTAVQLIDNAISGNEMQVDVVAALPAGTNSIGSTRPDTTDLNGASYITRKYYTNAGAVTDGIVWSPAAGTRWHITDIYIQVSAAATVTLEDDLSGGDSAFWKAELAANSGWSHSFKTPLVSGEDAADLIITTSAGNVYVLVSGYEI